MRLFHFFLLALFSCSCSSDAKKELHLFTWGNYIKPELISRFEKENDCHIVIDLYDSNESMYAKLKASARGYDLVFPSNYFLGLMINQNLVKPLDLASLPNLKYMDEKLLKTMISLDFHYAIPYMISFTGIGYRADRLQNITPSWDLFNNPLYSKRMTMLNDMREVLGAALKYLGYSLNTINDNEIERAAALAIEWKKNLAKFESEQYLSGIASREYLVVQCYSGQLLQLANEDPAVHFFLPQEGVPISCDYVAIPEGASEPLLAHKFINFLCEPKVAAENIVFTKYLAPNIGAYPLLPAELKESPILFPASNLLERSEVIEDVGDKNTEKYLRAWQKIRSAN